MRQGFVSFNNERLALPLLRTPNGIAMIGTGKPVTTGFSCAGPRPKFEVPYFISIFKHLSDSVSFFGCFAEPETARAITGLSLHCPSGHLPHFCQALLEAEWQQQLEDQPCLTGVKRVARSLDLDELDLDVLP
jgi:hypothetical protein